MNSCFCKMTRTKPSADLDKVREILRDRWPETCQAMEDRIHFDRHLSSGALSARLASFE
jgi:hypothetical protein